MKYAKAIRFNKHMRSRTVLFPRLPKIFKHIENEDGTSEVILKEINPGHTESVMRGYNQRVERFNKNQSI